MKAIRIYLIITPLLICSAFLAAQAPATIILVRHAEKSAPTGDVSLSDVGRARAASLAHVLADANIRLIFVTELKRTKETASSVSNKFHVEPSVITAADVDGLVAKLRTTPSGSTVLVVGHSNTLPEMIEKLGAGTIKIEDSEYDHLYIVTLESGKARLLALRY